MKQKKKILRRRTKKGTDEEEGEDMGKNMNKVSLTVTD